MSSSPILVNVQEDRLTASASSAKKANPFQNLVSPKTWKIFVSTFITIFLAEIGDKTQLTTLLMTAESHAPWIVFAGAGSALVLTSLLGVLLGQWLATRISPRTLERLAGSSLLVISALLIWEVLHS
ncbi:TMEM165/GDT1 family protein [Planktothrix sp. FACHB-1365]|uniref:TMEM165/GDT1 family protein n=1 Tax=Planktothrix sp. FACHB-1365 TaxID=2692855 RepID=UPI00168552CC|nr:TMEM165/GDT1 family protein [Planktothrix sp. FACHB-1365]MBD2482140.1 TMEM165/GDT1 family protein [Planktothrix sp. FACHB-1365]